MKKIREEKFSGSPDVNASVVSIGLTIFLLIFGAFYTISTGGFITGYGDLISVNTTVNITIVMVARHTLQIVKHIQRQI